MPTPITRPDLADPARFIASPPEPLMVVHAAHATEVQAQADPAPPTRDPETKAPATRSPDPAAVARRTLAGRNADVQRCANQHTGSIERLAVAMKVDITGRVVARAVGAADSPLSRCLDVAFRHTPIAAPSQPVSFVQVFKLRATPRP